MPNTNQHLSYEALSAAQQRRATGNKIKSNNKVSTGCAEMYRNVITIAHYQKGDVVGSFAPLLGDSLFHGGSDCVLLLLCESLLCQALHLHPWETGLVNLPRYTAQGDVSKVPFPFNLQTSTTAFSQPAATVAPWRSQASARAAAHWR